jgi:hypothetical protein
LIPSLRYMDLVKCRTATAQLWRHRARHIRTTFRHVGAVAASIARIFDEVVPECERGASAEDLMSLGLLVDYLRGPVAGRSTAPGGAHLIELTQPRSRSPADTGLNRQSRGDGPGRQRKSAPWQEIRESSPQSHRHAQTLASIGLGAVNLLHRSVVLVLPFTYSREYVTAC